MTWTPSAAYLRTVEHVRALLAAVPIRYSQSGAARLDFEAYRRGERRPKEHQP